MSSQSKMGKIEWLSKRAGVIWQDIYIADRFIHERIWVTSLATGVYPNASVFSSDDGKTQPIQQTVPFLRYADTAVCNISF